MLDIKNLKASIDEKEILKDVSMSFRAGEVHAIMGPNGSGKSTLAKVIAGHPDYEVTQGDIVLDNESILELEADDRALKGVFMAFQYPVEIPGVTNSSFLRMAYNAKQKFDGKDEVDPLEFNQIIRDKTKLLHIDNDFLNRSVNHGFSGGEKKRNEILQLAVLEPKVAILDETDSGLDIDALKLVSDAVNTLRSPDKTFVLVTHYQRLLNYIVPDYVHIFANGRVIKSGDKSLALEVEEKGYDWLLNPVGTGS